MMSLKTAHPQITLTAEEDRTLSELRYAYRNAPAAERIYSLTESFVTIPATFINA
jgi:hypothetical protein